MERRGEEIMAGFRQDELFNEGFDHFLSGQRSKHTPSLDGLRSPISGRRNKHAPSLDGLTSPFAKNMLLPCLALSRKACAGVPELDFDASPVKSTVLKSSSRAACGLGGSRSLPSLHAIAPPTYLACASVADPCRTPIPRRPSSQASSHASAAEHCPTPIPRRPLSRASSCASVADLCHTPIPRRPSSRASRAGMLNCTVTAEATDVASPASGATHSDPVTPQRLPSKASKKHRVLPIITSESPVATLPCSAATATPSTAIGSDSPACQLALVSPCVAGTNGVTPSSAMEGFETPSSAGSNGDQVMKWRQGDEIGAGSYGHVYMAQCKSTGHQFAVKVARIRDSEEEKFCEKLQKELDICKDLRHRHIVACLGHEFINRRLYIYLEYVPGGSLRHMVNQYGALQAPLLKKATRGMLKGLNYLHKLSPPVAHRDLKGANVLIDLQFCVKLADFGCSKQCTDMSRSFSKVGSIHWVAPEVLQDAGHGRRADIWSLGCVIIEIATAADPWGPKAFDNIMQAMHVISSSERTPPIPDALPDSARSLIRQCVQRSPEERPCASQLLLHPFLQSERSTPECCFSRPQSKSSATR